MEFFRFKQMWRTGYLLCSDIDEVILSYVVSLLEDLAEEKTEMTREEFEENVEMQMQVRFVVNSGGQS